MPQDSNKSLKREKMSDMSMFSAEKPDAPPMPAKPNWS